MLDNSFIDRIVDLSEPRYKEMEDGLTYCNKKLNLIAPPQVETLGIKSLAGVVDYVKTTGDLKGKGLFLVVHSETSVYLYGSINNVKERDVFIRCDMDCSGFAFNVWRSLEEFIIGIQALFIDGANTYAKEELLKFLGTITTNEIQKYIDTGVSQKLHIETGVEGNTTTAEFTAPQGPVLLKPYRTFREIDQPESLFQLRIRHEHSRSPQFALYEADGEAWKLEAIQRIKQWLIEELKDQSPKVPVIG